MTRNDTSRTAEALRTAVAEARTARPDVLSGDARTRIFRRVNAMEAIDEPRALFPPVHRWVVRATVTAAAAAMAAALLWLGGAPRVGETSDFARLEVRKVGDRVVFQLHNGGGPHTVVRSTTPQGTDAVETASLRQGSFEDRLDGGPGLVFYRID